MSLFCSYKQTLTKQKVVNMKKILIIRLGAIGDVVHTTNIIRSIKAKYPDAEIHYATGGAPLQLLKNDSQLSKVFLLSKKYSDLTKLGLQLSKEKYDLILNLQPSLRFRYLSFLCFAKKVVEYKKNPKIHAVENFFLTGAEAIDGLENPNHLKLELANDVIEKVQQEICHGKKIVVLNTQTSVTRKGRKWPEENFKKLALMLIEKYGCDILFTGAKEDIEAVKCYENLHPQVKVVAGKYSLAESAAVFSLCDLMISSDTGPLHIATAFEKPRCIGLFGAADSNRTGAWGKKHFSVSANLECSPCTSRNCKIAGYENADINPCLCAITPEMIIEVIEKNNLL